MNISSNIGRDQYASKRRIVSWSSHSDPFMVVLSEQSQFLALEVILAHLSAFRDGSRHNAFLASHGWAKNLLNNRKGSETAMLRGLARHLAWNPRQAALLLESEHILISREDREDRIRKAYGYFDALGCQEMLDMILCYLNAVFLVEEERRYEVDMAASRERARLVRLERLVARVRAMKAQRNFTEVLDTVKALLGMDTKATGKVFGVDLRHWRYLVSPLD